MTAPVAPESPDIPSRSAPEAEFDAKMFALFQWATGDLVAFMEAWRSYLATNSTIIGDELNAVEIGQSTPAAAAFTGLTSDAWAGTVAAAGQGYAFERGVNANGEYVRLADGTQICTNQAFQTSASDDVVWTYPATFLYPASPGRPAVSGAISATFGSDAFLGIGGIAGSGGIASQVSVRAIDLGGSRVALSAGLIAIGRWS